jgi:hypothetical protein
MAEMAVATKNEEAPKSERRRRLSSIGFLVASFLTVAVVVSGALFTEDEAVGNNLFTTGTVNIATTPATAVIAMDTMVPGDAITQGLDVHNAGTAQLRYSLSSTTTENVLAAQLDLTIWDEAAEADAGTTCSGTVPGTVLYGPGDLGSTTGINLLGNPSQGNHTGDRVLSANVHDYLCFKVSLPASTGNSFQGVATTSTLNFHAEQTTNN